MQGGDLSAKVALDTIQLSNDTYGLGVANLLEGEIVIIEGKVLRSWIEDDKVITRQESGTKAAMLVRSEVKSFNHSESILSLNSIQDLEKHLKQQGAKLYDEKPFAFMIKGKIDKVDYHIIDWQESASHTPNNHKHFAKHGSFANEEVIIVGFYSESHQGIFTPHSTNVHMHVYSPSMNVVGHVDGLLSTKEIKVLLP